MDKVEEQGYSALCEYYDSLAFSSELMKKYIETSTDEEKISLYNYVCRRCAELKDQEHARAVMGFYWMASVELEYTDAIKKYLNGEIKIEDVAKAEAGLRGKVEVQAQEDAEISEIMDLLERRKNARTPLGRLKNRFGRKGR